MQNKKQKTEPGVYNPTFRQILEFVNMGEAFLKAMATYRERQKLRNKANAIKEESKEQKLFAAETKFEGAIHRMINRCRRKLKRPDGYNEWVEDQRRDNALTSSVTGALMYEDRANGVYMFDPEGSKKLDQAVRKKMQETESIEQYILPAEDIPADLNDDLVEAFRGFVLPLDYELPLLGETPSQSEDKAEAEPAL